jgi:endothelin-converting enzyme/putative endopeptidase
MLILKKRAKYVLHVAKMLQYLGDKPAVAQANAEKILRLKLQCLNQD